MDLDIIESPPYVELGKVFHSLEFVNDFSDEREWVSVFDSKLIELPIVLDRVES
jgi:hypothetical protein